MKRWLRKAAVLRFAMTWLWPVWWFSGIFVTRIAPDFRVVEVELRDLRINRNYVGTHFGGTLFSMTDPFYMLMLLRLLGPRYVVWDQSAKIEFLKPGRGTVRAVFQVDDAILARLKRQAQNGAKVLEDFIIDIKDAQDEVVARVTKTLYVREKRNATQ